MSEIVSAILQILQLVSSDNVAKTLAVIGVLLLIGGGYLAYRLINQNPQQVGLWQKTLVLSLVFVGLLFTVAAPASTLWDRYTDTQHRADLCEISKVVDASESYKRLLENGRVDWLVRLIVYSGAEPGLKIQNLKSLGKAGQSFTFVADYEEMRGRKVTEATRLMGTTLEPGQKVSAIIFPRKGRKLIPANARGLLQAIADIESTMTADDGQKLEIRQTLSSDALAALDLDDEKQPISAWAWDNYKEFYWEYCKLAQRFRCKSDTQYAARAKLGELNDDWHPLGFSCREPVFANPCNPASVDKFCDFRSTDEEWNRISANYGVRVFFIRNEDLDTLDGRMLIDFDAPDEEYIPILLLKGREKL